MNREHQSMSARFFPETNSPMPGPARTTQHISFTPKSLQSQPTQMGTGSGTPTNPFLRCRRAVLSRGIDSHLFRRRVRESECLKTVKNCTFFGLQLTETLRFDKDLGDSGGGSFSSAGSPIPTSLANRCPNHLSFLLLLLTERELPFSEISTNPTVPKS